MKLKKYILCLLSSGLLLLPVFSGKACGYYDDESEYRAMMFRAFLPDMQCLTPYLYTMSLYYYPPGSYELSSDPNRTDRYRNCREWLAVCDRTVSIDDIYTIQYDTDGKIFINAYETNRWKDSFDDNTFIRFLLQKKNKRLLDYMLFAKKMELTEIMSSSRFEEWEGVKQYSRYYYEANRDKYSEDNVFQTKRALLQAAVRELGKASGFLRERYAFQVCRLQYQLGEFAEAVETFRRYFGDVNPKSLMSIWTGLFYAMSLPEDSNERYRYLTRVFVNSDEKKFRCVELFKPGYDAGSLSQSEQSTALVMLSLRNPGRAFEQMQEAYRLDKTNRYIPFLLLREINKLENWMITPVFYGKYSYTYDDPFRCAYYFPWRYISEEKISEISSKDETGRKLQAENLASDMEYITELKSFIKEILPAATGETKDFYAISLAHLSLLQENASDARRYLAMVSGNANPAIQLQKRIETIWLAMKTEDIHSKSFEAKFLENITALEKINTPGYENKHILYTLSLSLANEYLEKNDRVYGNLMRMKSDLYHYNYSNADEWYSHNRGYDYYSGIHYFDRNATISDMDKLIGILEKKDKTLFEQYLCAQTLCSVNGYKELKGTIAFRNRDLQLAYEVFASMPQDYWQSSNFYFASYLNEDPFVPKGLRENKYRKFDYPFNKAGFVKELIELQEKALKDKKHSAEYYIKLGDAYFNASYWGNAWMMTRYSWSIGDEYYSKTDCLPEWMRNYMTAGIACEYYEKAFQQAGNDEQRAYASVMLHYAHRLSYNYRGVEKDKLSALQYGNKFKKYQHTKAYKTYECPGIFSFLNSGGVRELKD